MSGSVSAGWFARFSLANRLFLLAVLATGAVMLINAVVVGLQLRNSAERDVEREFGASLELAAHSFELVFQNARVQAESLIPVLEMELGGVPEPSGDSVPSDLGVDIPILDVNGNMVNADTASLENLNANTGADAAVIARAGTHWVRIATLLRDGEGRLMLDSVVQPDDLLARTLDGGEPYSGLVQRNGQWYVMSIKPLKDEAGQVYGGMSVRVSIASEVDNLYGVVRQMRMAQFGSVGIARVDAKGSWHSAVPDAGLDAGLSDSRRLELGDLAQGQAQGFGKLAASAAGPELMVGWVPMPSWGVMLLGAGESEDFLANSRQMLLLLGMMMLAAIAIIAFVIWGVVRRTLRPLGQVVGVLDALGKGDLTSQMPAVPSNSRNEVHALFHNLGTTQRGLEGTIGSVHDAVGAIRDAISEILAGNTDLSSRTEEQAASLQETAASMEEISATVRQNTDHSRRADTMAGEFADVARRGERAVGSVVETMQEISLSSNQIGEIVQVIDGIAFQTNILALNAAVEAARAGEEGRGFAVVAGEVRALAQRSARAAGEIKVLIDNSLAKVDSGVQEVSDAGKTMTELLEAVGRMTNIVKEIAQASEEQATGIGEINRAISQMDEVTQQNAALVQQSAAAVSSLSDQADQLMSAVGVFVTNNQRGSGPLAPVGRNQKVPADAVPHVSAIPETRMIGI